MNNVLKIVLQTAEQVMRQLPAGAAVDDAAHAIVAGVQGHSEEAIWTGAEDAILASIAAIEQIQGTEIADERGFATGVAMLHVSEQQAQMAIALIRRSLKPTAAVPSPPPTAAVPPAAPADPSAPPAAPAASTT